MRIGIITSFPPSKVTLNEYGYHLVKNFAANDQVEEILLFCDKTDRKKTLDFANYEKVTVIECWQFNSYMTVSNIAAAVRKNKPDNILFNLQFMKFGDKKIAAALGLLLPKIIKNIGIPNTVLIHNILETVDLDSAGFARNPIVKSVYRAIGYALTRFILNANTVAVTIPKYKRILEKKYNSKNIVVIPHGTFETAKTPNFDQPSSTLQVMAFGKFGTYKKIEILIEAVEKIRTRINEKIEIVIAGTDNPNTIGYLHSIQNKYKHVPLLTFTGYVPENKVEEIFNNSTVVVFPYTSTTGSSGVLHQAGSFGKAVVLPNLGDLKELIQDEGYDGAFFDANSSESLSFAIERILTDKSYRITLEKNNFNAATAYPMSKICSMYLDTFIGHKKVDMNKIITE